MAIMINPRRNGTVKKSEESQRVLDRLDRYIEENCSEPMKWLVRFWKDQAAVLKYSELLSIVTDEDVPEKIFNDWFGDYSRLLAEKVTPLWKETMIAAVMDNPLFQNVGEEFNTADIYVREWIADRSATLVTACLDEQRQAIRYIIGEGKMNRWSTQETARYIRPTIGLTERQAAANQKYYNTIKEQTRRDHPRMTDEAVERKAREAAGRYAAKQQRYRAETISRTELATAYNEGNDQYARQIVRNGYLPAGKKYIKVWSTAGNNICPECETLEGTEVDMDEKFKVIRGKTIQRELTALIPPLHPRCKCAVLYEEAEDYTEDTPNAGNATEYRGLEDTWRELQENEQLNDVNPEDRQDNCVNCSVAFEMRCRGKAVIAGEPSRELQDNEGFAAWKNPEILEVSAKNAQSYISACLGLWGEESRAQITYLRNQFYSDDGVAQGHSFNAMQHGGTAHFIDPQLRVVYNYEQIEKVFANAYHIRFCRVDQLELNEIGFAACKEVK